jgi:predicted nucleotidyltransferase component of viral defense system
VIPRAHITAWRAKTPWPLDEQVEQDLVLSRAISEIFTRPSLREALAFRGGTALHKLFFDPPGRYSEDLDLVQVAAGPIKPLLMELQEALDPWLDAPSITRAADGVKLIYRYQTTAAPVRDARVKVEINTREHFAAEGFNSAPFVIESPWYSAAMRVTTYTLEELLATKLRALYQRRKGRDLYDLWLALQQLGPNEQRVVAHMRAYLGHAGLSVSRAEYEANMAGKLMEPSFRNDVVPLLSAGADYNVDQAYESVHARLISLIPGAPWKGGA